MTRLYSLDRKVYELDENTILPYRIPPPEVQELQDHEPLPTAPPARPLPENTADQSGSEGRGIYFNADHRAVTEVTHLGHGLRMQSDERGNLIIDIAIDMAPEIR